MRTDKLCSFPCDVVPTWDVSLCVCVCVCVYMVAILKVSWLAERDRDRERERVRFVSIVMWPFTKGLPVRDQF